MAEKQTRENLQIIVKGRLKESKQWESKRTGEIFFDNYIIIPSLDEFSHPQNFLVKATERLGRDGSDVEVLANVTSFVRTSDAGHKFHDNHLWAVSN
jgi:hypothetical protein